MTAEKNIPRREFLKVSAAVGGGLLVSLYLQACEKAPVPFTGTPNPEARFEPSVFVRIDGTGQVTLTIPRPDIGQGARTAVAMILAEELGARWEDVRVEQANAGDNYGNQATGGSDGISDIYTLLQRTGAVARFLLLTAAAQIWEVSVGTCAAEDGSVVHQPSGTRLGFGDLADIASTLPTPRLSEVRGKDPEDYTIVGTRVKRIDGPQMVDGSAVYGVDVTIPNMLYAVLARCPVPGGSLEDFNDSSALDVDGVRYVTAISNGVAVVADSTWAAMRGREALELIWDFRANAEVSTASMRQSLLERVLPANWTGESTDPDMLAAVYEVPHLAHATMEPLSCVADVRNDSCEVWAPTQDPVTARSRARNITRLPNESITVHVPMIGGGFGRRLQVDYVEEAVEISASIGHPVKLMWTREDDIRHDYYHPFSVHYVRADLTNPRLPWVDTAADSTIPSGAWRSVTNFTDAFVRECFIDEMATALNRDPLELRLEIEPANYHAVLEKAAAEAGWGSDPPDGWGRGIACHSTWNASPVALVADVSVSSGGEVRVQKVVCAVDCGLVINPNMVEEQMEGGIVFGLSAALKGSITFEDGRAQQSNFHDYPMLTIGEMPEIEVHILSSDRPPSGVGEMSIPVIAPAVFNAIYAATGKRIRHMPLRPSDIVED
jgi:isoquinoline 1-oxidoreductase beta subunit